MPSLFSSFPQYFLSFILFYLTFIHSILFNILFNYSTNSYQMSLMYWEEDWSTR